MEFRLLFVPYLKEIDGYRFSQVMFFCKVPDIEEKSSFEFIIGNCSILPHFSLLLEDEECIAVEALNHLEIIYK